MLLLLLACHPPADKSTPDDTGAPDTADTGDTSDTAETGDTADTGTPAEGCRAEPLPADRDRDVLLALPYDSNGSAADTWAVVTLGADGELRDDGERVEMGRATLGEAVFTPDASLALAPTEDGSLAVWDANTRAVVDPAWDGGFYAERVVMDPSGEHAWIIDGNWENNGGGVYRVDIDCETGALSGATRVVEARMPADLEVWEGVTLLAGRNVPGASKGDDLALLTWGDTPTFQTGVDAFGDDEAIVSDLAVAGDWALLADNAAFTEVGGRVARVRLGESPSVEAAVEVEDPMDLVPFPDGEARVLVSSGFGDSLWVLDAETGAFARVNAASVQLPGAMVAVERGSLSGLVLVSEVEGLRRVQLDDTGATDLGVWSIGNGLDALPGAVGVAP